MTLIELQAHLGRTMNKLMDDSLESTEKRDAYERADFVAKIAKQMINNADVILRADKLRADGNGQHANITRLILDTDED